ncbi:MAG: glycosyltransferase family 9 protein [Bacteroidales bacterium]|nr:glycosyltransferase family 9 protein [Bacteroidales bacterium]
MREPTNILIARLSSIGDIILTTPVVRSVRTAFPRAKISFLVKKEFADLVQHHPGINEVIVFDKSKGISELLRLRKLLSKKKFDWLVDLHNNLRTNFLKHTVYFRDVTTYRKQTYKRKMLIWFGKNNFDSPKPVFLKYFEAVEKRNLVYDQRGTSVFFPESELEAIKQKLTNDGLGRKTFVVICPAASYANKRWLPERFAEAADLIIARWGFSIILLGGPADFELCESIIKQMKGPALNYAGQLSLLGSTALLSIAEAAITNDSGLMHLAQSQKTPVIAIFGPTTQEMGFFPLKDGSSVVQKNVRCRPCTTKGMNYCPRKHFKCMKGIEAKEIIQALESYRFKKSRD